MNREVLDGRDVASKPRESHCPPHRLMSLPLSQIPIDGALTNGTARHLWAVATVASVPLGLRALCSMNMPWSVLVDRAQAEQHSASQLPVFQAQQLQAQYHFEQLQRRQTDFRVGSTVCNVARFDGLAISSTYSSDLHLFYSLLWRILVLILMARLSLILLHIRVLKILEHFLFVPTNPWTGVSTRTMKMLCAHNVRPIDVDNLLFSNSNGHLDPGNILFVLSFDKS